MKWWLYRLVMKVAHKYNWHYAPPIYPEGDTMLWCKWCGFREVVKRGRRLNDAFETKARPVEEKQPPGMAGGLDDAKLDSGTGLPAGNEGIGGVVSGKVSKTPNRRSREAYNAYQREYMRKRRERAG